LLTSYPGSQPRIDPQLAKFSPLRYFDRDPATKTIYAVQGENRIKRIRDDEHGLPSDDFYSSDSESSIADKKTPLWLHKNIDCSGELLAQLTSKISSLAYFPASGALAATTYGSDRPPVVYLSDPDRDGPFVHQTFTLKGVSSIQDSAARPNTLAQFSNAIAAADSENLAVAAQSSLMLFTRSPSGTWDSTRVLETNNDILTVDWMSPTVIALGQRNGKIRLYDTRSRGSSHILTHPGPIGKIRRADDPTRIVAAGIQDTLFLYDIRAPRCSGSTSDSENQHYNEQYFAARNTGYYHGSKRRKLMQGALQW
jgi:WD40 repeat protein